MIESRDENLDPRRRERTCTYNSLLYLSNDCGFKIIDCTRQRPTDRGSDCPKIRVVLGFRELPSQVGSDREVSSLRPIATRSIVMFAKRLAISGVSVAAEIISTRSVRLPHYGTV